MNVENIELLCSIVSCGQIRRDGMGFIINEDDALPYVKYCIAKEFDTCCLRVNGKASQ